MDQTHLHLMITHLPIYGAMLGALVLGYGLFSKSNQTKIAAYYVFVVSAMGAGIAYLTGESAEETVEDIQGVAKNLIEEHEDFALFALVSILVLGVASLYGIFVTYRKSQQIKTVSILILLISLISWGLVARTGYLGGQIRHTEISKSKTPANSQPGETGEKDDASEAHK